MLPVSICIIRLQCHEVIPEFLSRLDNGFGVNLAKIRDDPLPMKQVKILDDKLKKIVMDLRCCGNISLLLLQKILTPCDD